MSIELWKLVVIAGVFAVAVVMMLMGASEVTFMGLLFTVAGVACCYMAYRAKTKPDSFGTEQPVGMGTVITYAVLGVAMLVAGPWILIARPF